MLGLAEGMAKGYLPLNRTDMRPYTVICMDMYGSVTKSQGDIWIWVFPRCLMRSHEAPGVFNGETNCFWGPRVSKDPSFWDSKSPQKKVIDDSWLPHVFFFRPVEIVSCCWFPSDRFQVWEMGIIFVHMKNHSIPRLKMGNHKHI